MKERLLALRAKLDAMSLRERVMVFAAAAALLIFVVNALAIEPLQKRQDALRSQIDQQRKTIAAIDAGIVAQVEAWNVDPDKDSRSHLAALQADADALGQSLRAMQNGLVEPERVAPLLETMLKANGRLQLVSLKTLPVTVMNGQAPSAPASAPAPAQGALPGIQPGLANLAKPPAPVGAVAGPAAQAPVAKPLALLYRHGVQVTVRGNYLDMVDYLATLEAMPARLFWGSAALQVEQYPNSRLTLTVYTLSLDEQWMKL